MNKLGNGRTRAGLILAAVGLIALWVAGHVTLTYYVDVIWFRAVGFADVFWTILGTRAILAAATGALTFAVLYLNMWVARRYTLGPDPRAYAKLDLEAKQVDAAVRIILAVAALFVASLVGLSASRNWIGFLNFRYAAPFGLEDPVFGHDVGFYVFRLPAIAYVCQTALILTFLSMGAACIVYFVRGAIDLSGEKSVLLDAPLIHVSVLGAIAAALFAGQCWLSRYQVLFSKRGAVFGAGYTDVHAQVGAQTFLALAAVALAGWLLVSAFRRTRLGNLYALGAYALAWVLAGAAYPGAVQTFLVKPNEFAREEPYIERNIRFTRHAYGLEHVTEHPWPGDGALGPDQLAAHPGTIDNLLLWDPAPLRDMYNQKQRIRLYYNFSDVDVDRYTIDGRPRPVMLAARELDPLQLPEKSRVWTNLHIEYTHGYGLCLSLGNRAAPGGLPEFLVSNIPPETRHGLEVAQPRIYYGEQTRLYALTHSRPDEFDYPGDPENFFNRYDGRGGVPVGGLLRRAILSWHTGHKEILFTDQFTDASRILLFRQVRERAMEIAPFLHFDQDPYPVLLDGRIIWVLDAYTLTRRFPYSETVGIANYWRNSVKVTVDAYDGTVTFYRFDATDPILRVLDRIFPDLFQPPDTMPEALRAHLRYPKDLFQVQTALYRRYHMADPRVFFTGEDMWTFPKSGSRRALSFEPPRYLVLELPESDAPEQFVLARTFTVEGKDNMIAWMAGGCDGDHYGRLTVYRLPKARNIYGPNQAKGRFNQDPDISAFMTLMGQLGSAVIQSPVLAIPIEQGLLYLQSLYVEDPQVKIPELKQIILGHGDRVAMAPSIDEALNKLFGERPPVPTPSQAMVPLQPPTEPYGEARQLYQQARERLKEGDWAAFGEAFDSLGRILGITDR